MISVGDNLVSKTSSCSSSSDDWLGNPIVEMDVIATIEGIDVVVGTTVSSTINWGGSSN